MIVTVNGDSRELPEAATVTELVVSLGGERDGRGVAVAVDGEVVPRSAWDDFTLSGGAHVEVLVAVQGG